MCDSLRAWDVEFYPLTKTKSTGNVGSFVQIFGQGLKYGYSEFSTGLQMFGSPPQDMITFNIMEPTNRRYWVRGMDLGDDTIWVFPKGSELESCAPPGFQVHTLSVSEGKLEAVSEALRIPVPIRSRRRDAFTIPPKYLAIVRNQLRAIRDGAAQTPEHSMLDILHAIFPLWLEGPSRSFDKRPSMRARDIAVRKCLELFENCDLGTLSSRDLVKECNISERTLQYAFLERFGASPADFIKSKRLGNARLALRLGHHDKDSVGDIAFSLGFWHLGQFGVEYKRLFGERPSQTLKTS